MGGLGVKLGEPRLTTGSVLAADGTLQEALVIGGFQGTDFDNALDQDFLGAEGSVAPKPGEKVGDLTWAKRASGVGGVFDLQPLEVAGPAANRAAYLSFWIYSSRPLDELLAQPDVPQINVTFGAGEAMKAWFNGKALAENRTRGPIDSNRQTFNALPLKKGWNHFLIKVAKGSEAWRFSARFACSNPQFLGELQSASEPPPGK
jgi:beta-galactosidase